ncbi:adhesion G protein-coupled receptor F5 [Gadus morhua]|uniref:adhesion G protein-coupled receptor F5 n=1 Tax=Gadus morhua TaxID=8049 RepID=UPI0011B6E9E7|nr:adhesion G protein-coupled receptor F5-like [Gadus morhua]
MLRQKRAAPDEATFNWTYVINIEVNGSSGLIAALNNISLPIQLNNITQISEIQVTTACTPVGAGEQCRCQEGFAWPIESCLAQGACDVIAEGVCSCINGPPADGQSCQPIKSLQAEVVLEVVVELHLIDLATLETLRARLENSSFPLALSPAVEITDINITTVCSPFGAGFQCTCEDPYRWPCDKCLLHGSCDNITDETCGCINALPPDEEYCQLSQLINATCPITTSAPPYTTSTPPSTTSPPPSTTSPPPSTTSPNPSTTSQTPSTSPPVFYEYLITIELQTTNVTVIEELRSILDNISYPFPIDSTILISEVNITTVCSPFGAGFQCTCEDPYRWPCDKCLLHGSCDNITDETCGCINALPPDEEYCQLSQLINTTCPITTSAPPFTTSTPPSTTSPPPSTTSPPPSTTSPPPSTTSPPPSTTSPPPSTTSPPPSTSPPVVYEYLTTIELQTTNVTVIEDLRSILDNISYPFPIDNNILISEVNITTVCSPFGAGFQCTCEDPYRWPCDKCLLHGSCDNITDETCGCINALPPDEEYCQLSQQIPLNRTFCPLPPSPPPSSNPSPPPSSTPSPPHQQVRLRNLIEVVMLMTLDLTFTPELSNPTSSQFIALRGRVQPVLEANYQSLTGFRSINVRGFSAGSVVVDFTIRTTEVVDGELTAANLNLTQSFEPIAAVLGLTTEPFISPDPITFPSPVYTGQARTLTCGPPPPQAGIGVVTSVSWTLGTNPVQNRDRFQITSSATGSRLTISNLVPSDRGAFTCTLVSGALRFIQRGRFTTTTLLAAPVLLVNRESNAVCRGGGNTDTPRRCCVQPPYRAQWVGVTPGTVQQSVEQGNNCVQYDYRFDCTISTPVTTICRVIGIPGFQASSRLNIITAAAVICNDMLYGVGGVGDESRPGCDIGLEGERLAVCQASGVWLTQTNTCILTRINELLTQSESLNENSVPTFVAELSGVVSDNQTQITNSPVSISAIVDILINVGNGIVSGNVGIVEETMQSILNTVDVIVGDVTVESWANLNANQTLNTSSLFLSSMETITQFLSGDFSVTTPSILLNRTQFSDSFTADINSSLVINLQNTNLTDTFITTITFSTLSNVLPPRTNASFNASQDANATGPEILINAAVVLIQLNGSRALRPNLTLSYRKRNTSLTEDPQCVFWNFQLLDFQGGWDDEGCTFVSDVDDVVECNCDHLTSFSMLMSTGLPPGAAEALDIITYIGVAISIVSLVICLIIEALTWKAMTGNLTSYLRHVSLVNIAVSLLIADIWFIIGAAITSETDPTERVPLAACSAATFFIHLFYLALFFWMLVSALLLFYRTVMVFSHMSKATMLAIGFSLGYGAPLVIAVVTVAATAPQVPQGYIRDNNGCWLRWEDTFALLAFIIPAGVIVFINFVILIVVLTKMLRRGVESSHSEEKNTLLVILRSVAILFPTFGLTWALGVGVMVAPRNLGLHVTFALFNSLQGFFILVFGTLMDRKVRAVLSRTVPALNSSSNQTRTTSGGGSSTGRWALLNRIRGRRDVYHVTSTGNSSSNTASESYLNI